MTNIILIAISMVIIFGYLILYSLHCGLPTSISETYYHTENKWVFPAVISVGAALAWIPLVEITPETYQFLSFFICAAIIFVAASPAFKDEFIGKIHTCAAVTLAISALAWIILVCGIPYIAILGAIVGLFNRKRFVFWLEVGILIDLYLHLLVLLHICSSTGA